MERLAGRGLSLPRPPRGLRKRKTMNKILRRAAMAALDSPASATAVTALMPAYAAVPARNGPNAKADAATVTGRQARIPDAKPLTDALNRTGMKDFAGQLARVK